MGLVVVVVASVKGVKGSPLFRLSNRNGHIITIGDKVVPSMHISYGHMTALCVYQMHQRKLWICIFCFVATVGIFCEHELLSCSRTGAHAWSPSEIDFAPLTLSEESADTECDGGDQASIVGHLCVADVPHNLSGSGSSRQQVRRGRLPRGADVSGMESSRKNHDERNEWFARGLGLKCQGQLACLLHPVLLGGLACLM